MQTKRVRTRLHTYGPEKVLLEFIAANSPTRQEALDYAYHVKSYTRDSVALAFADLHRASIIFKRDGVYKTEWTQEDVQRGKREAGA